MCFLGMSLHDYQSNVVESSVDEEEESDAASNILTDEEEDAENHEPMLMDDDLTSKMFNDARCAISQTRV